MKRKMRFLSLISGIVLSAMITFNTYTTSNSATTNTIELSSIMRLAFADGESGGYSCTVTSNCFNWGGQIVGSVSCTGTESCSRGYEWVKCDGIKTEC